MTSRWWGFWKLQAKFWIYRSNKPYQEKKVAIEHLENEDNIIWKERANRGMKPLDAVKTYFKFKR